MAVALLTTLYGALVANFICLHLADKQAMRSQQEQQSKAIIREAAVGINQALSPMVQEESLKINLSHTVTDKKAKATAAADEPVKKAA